MLRSLIILLLIALTACTETVEVTLPPELNAINSKDRGNPIKIPSDHKAYNVLQEWLTENRADWSPTSGKYPGGLYIKAGEYGVQILRTHVVLYSTIFDTPKAVYIQQLSGKELAEVKRLTP